ncbi:MAG: hypothetical protein AAGI38_11120 [Bacteroidota bacterium]
MKYIEYVWLGIAGMQIIFLSLQFRNLPTAPLVALMVGITICGFMYSFRRGQRQLIEKREKEELEALEKEVEGTNKEQEQGSD